MQKEIIFFDGDGTLWYPKKSKHTRHPVWLYRDKRYKNHTNHLVMIPSVLSTIKKLKRKGVTTVILSTHPNPSKEADLILNHKVKHFKLTDFFDKIYVTKPYPKSKGEFILKILKRRKISKSKALMVGDSYIWDYKSAKDRGIDALLLESKYEPMNNSIKRKIKKINEVLNYID